MMGLAPAEDTVARDLTLAIMRHYGYTEDDLAIADAIHPGRICGEECEDEDGRTIHPEVYDELNRTAALMVDVVSPYVAGHIVHVTATPVAEDVVWCDECDEWVSPAAPEPTVAEQSRVCADPECTIPRKPGRPAHGPHDFRAGG